MHQRISVIDFVARSQGRGVIAETHATNLRLRGIEPPTINAFGEKFVTHLFPVSLPSYGAERVIPLAMSRRKGIRGNLREHAADGIEFLAVFAAEVELRPDGDERMVVHFVQFLEHSCRIRVARGIRSE